MNAPLRLPHVTGHAIETLSWTSVGAMEREAAHAYQARLSRFLNGRGREVIARVFTRLSPPGEHWRIDRLEIDTGPLAEDAGESQWAAVLEAQLVETLTRARRASGGASLTDWAQRVIGTGGNVAAATAPRPADHQALEHFLFYLQRGHLPWSHSPMAGRALSAWLALLARRIGPRLWSMLQRLQPGDYVLARLSRITPHEGLQALIGVRYRELADSLSTLDAQVLAPLQARGRLSAYQVQQLQQAWRVSAFRLLWGQRAGNLSADGLRRLQRELGAALVRQLGQGGFGQWRPSLQPVAHAEAYGDGGHPPPGGRARPARMLPRLDQLLLGGVIAAVERSGRRKKRTAPADDRTHLDTSYTARALPANDAVSVVNPARVAYAAVADTTPTIAPARGERPVEAALRRLGAALDGSAPLRGHALQVLIDDLHARVPNELRIHLQGVALRRGETGRWLPQHGIATVWRIVQILAGAAETADKLEVSATSGIPQTSLALASTVVATRGAHWAESLRQFSLAAVSRGTRPGRGRRAGVSALQAWLVAYTLRQLALGERAPTDQRGWQRFWERAVAAWQRGTSGVRPARPQRQPPRWPMMRPRKRSPERPLENPLDSPFERRLEPPVELAREQAPKRPLKRSLTDRAPGHAAPVLHPFERRPSARNFRWEALHTVTTLESRLSHLAAFAKVPRVRRDWIMRNRLSEWLAEPSLCATWMARTAPAQRWELLAVLRPRDIGTLRRTSDVLQSVQAALLPKRTAGERQRSHWQFLTGHVFAADLPIAPAMLARRYAIHLCREQTAGMASGEAAAALAQPAHATRSAPLRQWLARVAAALAPWRWLSLTGTAMSRAAARILNRAPSPAEQWEVRQPMRGISALQPGGTAAPPAIGAAASRQSFPMHTMSADDPHYIDNGGLVLLATYTQRLFAMLNLLEGNAFRDAAAASRAVRCLAYLAEGHDGASEAECVLPKLLCGMAQSAPLGGDAAGDLDDALDDATIAVLDSLLDAVVAHWTALGKTSRDGLRQTFLQREGRLAREHTEGGMHWRLVLKTGAFDMLLDRLPWSFGTIKLPWMREVLYVDWR